MNTLRISLIITLLFALVPLQASAQSQEDRDRARQLYDEAAQCYNLGQYNCALGKWQTVYELTGVPAIRYNLGNTHERLGNLEKAVEHLEAYKPHAKPSQRDVLDSRIANLRERLTLQQQAAQAEAAERKEIEKIIAQREAEAKRLEEQQRELEQERAALEEALKEAKQARKASPGLQAARWTSLIIGIGGVATGVGFQVKRASLKSDLDAQCIGNNGTYCPVSVQSDVDAYNSAKGGIIAGYTIGGIALTTSLVTFLIKGKQDVPENQSNNSDVSFAPTWYANGGGGFQIHANF